MPAAVDEGMRESWLEIGRAVDEVGEDHRSRRWQELDLGGRHARLSGRRVTPTITRPGGRAERILFSRSLLPRSTSKSVCIRIRAMILLVTFWRAAIRALVARDACASGTRRSVRRPCRSRRSDPTHHERSAPRDARGDVMGKATPTRCAARFFPFCAHRTRSGSRSRDARPPSLSGTTGNVYEVKGVPTRWRASEDPLRKSSPRVRRIPAPFPANVLLHGVNSVLTKPMRDQRPYNVAYYAAHRDEELARVQRRNATLCHPS